MTLLDRYKVPFYHQQLEVKWGYLVSKDGQKRREPFRVKLKKQTGLYTYCFSINVPEHLRMASYRRDVSCRVGMMYCQHDVLQWHWHGRASTTMAVLWQCNGTARATPWQFHGSTMAGPWQCHGRAILQALSNTLRITIKD